MLTIGDLKAILAQNAHLPDDTPLAIRSSASNDDFSWGQYNPVEEIEAGEMTPLRRKPGSVTWEGEGTYTNLDEVDPSLEGRNVLIIS